MSPLPRRTAALSGLALAAIALGGFAPGRLHAASTTASLPAVADAITLSDRWIREQIEYHRVPGVAVAVVHDGVTVWSAGFGKSDLATGVPITPDTRFRIGSVSKLFTATAAMILRDEGRLRLEDPVAKHLPWLAVRNPYSDRPAITVEQLLTHTSGLPREGPFPYWTTHDFPTREALAASLGELSLVSRPGEAYRYSNLGAALLGEVVAAASGESWASFVDRRILAPLGMTASRAEPPAADFGTLARAYLRKRPDGSRGDAIHYETRALAPASSVVSTANDLARFAAFHLEVAGDAPAGAPSAPSGAAPLSTATRREMQRARFVYNGWNGGRGLGFAVSRRDNRTYVSHAGWIGGHRTELVLDPARNVAALAITNADDASPGFFARKVLDLVGTAIAKATTQAPPAKVADPAWNRYLGRYTDPWEWEYEVLILDGGLVLYEHDYPPDDDPDAALNRLTPTGEPGRFKMDDGEPIVFETDAGGNVVRLFRRFEYLTPVRSK